MLAGTVESGVVVDTGSVVRDTAVVDESVTTIALVVLCTAVVVSFPLCLFFKSIFSTTSSFASSISRVASGGLALWMATNASWLSSYTPSRNLSLRWFSNVTWSDSSGSASSSSLKSCRSVW